MPRDEHRQKLGGSYRDPSGFVFLQNGTLYRQVNQVCSKCYDALMSSGLYDVLAGSGRMVAHVELPRRTIGSAGAYRILKPDPVPFVSYPYEWSPSELRDAALLTIDIQRTSLAHGMSLKDATPFNVQFFGCKPVFVDTLSFEMYREGLPWVAYRQFCEQFLAPLVLQAYADPRMSLLLRPMLEGIPLEVASKLLPLRARFRPGLLTHLLLHGSSQRRYEDRSVSLRTSRMTRTAMLGLLDSLERTITSLPAPPRRSHWSEYYQSCSYDQQALDRKLEFVKRSLFAIHARTVWDLGANTGMFSRAAAETGAFTVSFDLDTASVDALYSSGRAVGEGKILPLVLDLANPSPSLGWHHRERLSLVERGPADLVLALALVHHLAIGRNLPFDHLAAFLREIAAAVVVEFVPKEDPQVRRMLRSREDVFPQYDRPHFEREFGRWFRTLRREELAGSGRVLYLMVRKGRRD